MVYPVPLFSTLETQNPSIYLLFSIRRLNLLLSVRLLRCRRIMLKRLSHIRHIKFNSLGIASVFQAGDTNEIDMKIKVLAVQRSLSTFYENEGSFKRKEYPIFEQHAVKLLPETRVQTAFCHEVPVIHVRNIKIQGVSSSSVFHAGSASVVRGDARIKHIRQIIPPNSQSSGTGI